MPYIDPSKRAKFDTILNDIDSMIDNTNPGELNYIVTKIIDNYVNEENYEKYNEILGTLEAVKQEFYRRQIAKYEDTKIDDNGDIFHG